MVEPERRTCAQKVVVRIVPGNVSFDFVIALCSDFAAFTAVTSLLLWIFLSNFSCRRIFSARFQPLVRRFLFIFWLNVLFDCMLTVATTLKVVALVQTVFVFGLSACFQIFKLFFDLREIYCTLFDEHWQNLYVSCVSQRR